MCYYVYHFIYVFLTCENKELIIIFEFNKKFKIKKHYKQVICNAKFVGK